MDESLELPTPLPNVPLGDLAPEDNEGSSDEEDGQLDWTKFLPPSARPVIPKRGEKEFEPRDGGGSNLQLHVLDRARFAMFDTLRATRTISSKAVSYATWYPDLGRTHVTLARGIHFSNMGHSAPRPVEENGVQKVQKRLELLPEEAIYLIERGCLFCWKQIDLDVGQVPGLNDVNGSPMSVQQAYAEMIGREGLTLEKFQVYAYLKRLGYVVSRANPPDIYYPVPPTVSISTPAYSILEHIKSRFRTWMSSVFRVFVGSFDWWKPVRISRWLHHDKNYSSLFKRIRFMTAGHNVPLKLSKGASKISSPYQIFFNLYKPSTPFKKSAHPPPDFQVVVINARTTPMPTLQELTDLFDVLPEVPLPPPRQRRQLLGASNATTAALNPVQPPIPEISSQNSQPTLIRRFFPWIFSAVPPANLPLPKRKPNPFVALKTGKKIIVIAVVDAGSTSFFRFGQGEFTEWPMV